MVTKHIAASVRQRLLNRARSEQRPFSELLQYYAMERFLYRLSQSAHANRFILKGALMLRVWNAPELRPTMDIDMLGVTNNDEDNIIAQMREILAVNVEPDGLAFDSESIQPEPITEDADYQGIRIRFRGVLDSARISMQIDIGFGDIVHPKPEVSELPTMLDYPAPKLLCYSRESTIAEKFEAMINRGMLNSRMKDFFDIWLLSRQFDFEGSELTEAIRLTFEQRGTVLPSEIEAFQNAFISAKQVQWTAFHKRLKHEYLPTSFDEIVSAIEIFLRAPIDALLSDRMLSKRWAAGTNWR